MKQFNLTLAVICLTFLGLQTNAGVFYEHKYIGDSAFKAFIRELNLELFFKQDLQWQQFGDGGLEIPFKKDAKVINYYKHMFAITNGKVHYSYGDLSALSADHSIDVQQLFEALFKTAIFESLCPVDNSKKLTAELENAFSKQRTAIDNGLREASYYNLSYLHLAAEDNSHFLRPPLDLLTMLNKIDPQLLKLGLKVVQYACTNKDTLFPYREELAERLLALDNPSKYAFLHLFAMHFMNNAAINYSCNNTDEFKLDFALALMYNAFADHFLQDAFAAGHMVVKRNKLALDNNGIHDYYNRIGLTVTNQFGSSWKTYGDHFYDDTTFNRAIAANVISLKELWAVFDSTRSFIAEQKKLGKKCGKKDLLLPESTLKKLSESSAGIPVYLDQHFIAYRYTPIPLTSEQWDKKFKCGSKNGMYGDVGFSRYADQEAATGGIGWHGGLGFGYNLIKPKVSPTIANHNAFLNKEAIFWIGFRLNYSHETLPSFIRHKYLFYIDATIHDWLAIDLGSGWQTSTGNHFILSPALGYEWKRPKCGWAPSLKIYSELFTAVKPQYGLRISLRLY